MTGKQAKSGRIEGKKARCRALAHVTEDQGRNLIPRRPLTPKRHASAIVGVLSICKIAI